MTFLPIVDRELRVAAQARATYWIRVIATLVGMLICAWVLFVFGMMGSRNMMGPMLFGWLTGVATLYCGMAGLFRTSDCLSRERREGTLGLLFLTDLSGLDIVLGKLVAQSVHWVYGLISLFPILAISWLVGGVALGEFWRMLLVLVNLMFFSLATGILVSSISRNERKAFLGTFLLLAVVFLGTGIVEDGLNGAYGSAWLLYLNPAYGLSLAADAIYPRHVATFWVNLGVSQGLSWVYLCLASLFLMRMRSSGVEEPRRAEARSQDQPSSSQETKARHRGQREAAFRRRALDTNPVYWLGSRQSASGRFALLAVVLMVLYICYQVWDSPSMLTGGFFGTSLLVTTMQLIVKVWLTFEVCRMVLEDRQSGALELVLVTPCTVPSIIQGNWMALKRLFGPAVGVVLACDFLLLLFLYNTAQPGATPFGQWHSVAMLVCIIVVFMVDLKALGWLGMWFGLTSRHVTTAAGRALLLILVLPYVVYWFLITIPMWFFFYLTNMGQGPAGASLVMQYISAIYIGSWLFTSLLFSLGFGLWARRRLYRRFREQVALQYQQRKTSGGGRS